MIRTILFFAIAMVSTGLVAAQAGLQKMVDAEQAFARLAAEKGTRVAFLANLEDTSVIFNPDRIEAKPFWTARAANALLLSWAPNYADITPDGSIGYTTGNWEFRPKGKDDTPVAFGEFITVWRRQPDGAYKWAVDVGIDHDKPSAYSTDWATTKSKADNNTKNIIAAGTISKFAAASSNASLKAFETFADDTIRVFREGSMPLIGKAAALKQIEKESGQLTIESGGIVSSHQNLAYFVKTYSLKKKDGSVEKGNAVQIWKFQGGKWKIVLDILKPVPAK